MKRIIFIWAVISCCAAGFAPAQTNKMAVPQQKRDTIIRSWEKQQDPMNLNRPPGWNQSTSPNPLQDPIPPAGTTAPVNPVQPPVSPVQDYNNPAAPVNPAQPRPPAPGTQPPPVR